MTGLPEPGFTAADPGTVRRVASRFATGVAVVTTRTDAGFHGVTVSSFTWVSYDPPLVLICLDKLLHSHDLVEESGIFGVSILSADQEFLAERFAGRAPLVDARFSGVPYHTTATGAPLIEGALGWLDCRLHATYVGGDHSIFVGLVVAAEFGVDGRPLLYYVGRYADLLVR
jgi:flavin reductase (DIM6/NTAB) family NADH-FMN oxidoreductase RutF